MSRSSSVLAPAALHLDKACRIRCEQVATASKLIGCQTGDDLCDARRGGSDSQHSPPAGQRRPHVERSIGARSDQRLAFWRKRQDLDRPPVHTAS
jgi:hypothetical protein